MLVSVLVLPAAAVAGPLLLLLLLIVQCSQLRGWVGGWGVVLGDNDCDCLAGESMAGMACNTDARRTEPN